MEYKKSDIEINFNKAARSYDSVASVQNLSSIELVNLIESSCDITAIKSVLDIGCGSGNTSLNLQNLISLNGKISNSNQSKFDLTLCDISKNMIQIAVRKISNAKILHCDAEHYNFTSHYDLCISNLSIQWFENYENFIEKMKSHCKIFAFSVPVSLFSKYKNSSSTQIYRYHSLKEIENTCKKYGILKKFVHKEYSLKFSNFFGMSKYFVKLGAGVKSFNKENISKKIGNENPEIYLNYNIAFAVVEF